MHKWLRYGALSCWAVALGLAGCGVDSGAAGGDARVESTDSALTPAEQRDPTFYNGASLRSTPVPGGDWHPIDSAVLGGGNFIVVGTSLQKQTFLRIYSDGSRDTTGKFKPTFPANLLTAASLDPATVSWTAIVSTGTNNFVLGGTARTTDGSAWKILIGGFRNDETGSVDPSFKHLIWDVPGTTTEEVRGLAVDDENRIVISASYNAFVSFRDTRALIRRLQGDGTIDLAFGINTYTGSTVGKTDHQLEAGRIKIQPWLNNIYMLSPSGYLLKIKGTDGSLDTTFAGVAPGGRGYFRTWGIVQDFAPIPDGTVYMTYDNSSPGVLGTIGVWAVAQTGKLEKTFGSGGVADVGLKSSDFSQARGIVYDVNTKRLYVGGYSGYLYDTDHGSLVVSGRTVLLAFTPNGQLDPAFGDHGLVTKDWNDELYESFDRLEISHGRLVAMGAQWASEGTPSYSYFGRFLLPRAALGQPCATNGGCTGELVCRITGNSDTPENFDAAYGTCAQPPPPKLPTTAPPPPPNMDPSQPPPNWSCETRRITLTSCDPFGSTPNSAADFNVSTDGTYCSPGSASDNAKYAIQIAAVAMDSGFNCLNAKWDANFNLIATNPDKTDGCCNYSITTP